jgi:hypothetical protein
MPVVLDEYALEIAYEVLSECEIASCQSCHDAARKTISTYLTILEQQVRLGEKRKVLPELFTALRRETLT